MAIGGKAIGLRNVEMGNFEDSTEILDTTTMTWKLTGKMNEKRKSPGVAQLDNQTVIAAGGTGAAKVPLNSVEIWNPKTEEWKHIASMNTARDSMGYALLPDGRFMVTGGKSIDKKGVLICGTGVGMSVAANKFKNIRAGPVSYTHLRAHETLR